jgi:hypothetical protein
MNNAELAEQLEIAARILREDLPWDYFRAPDWIGAVGSPCRIIDQGYPIRIKPVPDKDGWIPWHGGQCPVPGDTLVDYQTRNGTSSTRSELPENLRWTHSNWNNPSDITAYRLAKVPVPEYAPLGPENVPPLSLIRLIGSEKQWLVTGWDANSVFFHEEWTSCADLMGRYEIHRPNGEWEPCRKVKGGLTA